MTRPLRILLAADFLGAATGGLERALVALAEGLLAAGHDVRLATLPAEGDDDAALPAPVTRLRGWQRAIAPLHADPRRPFHVPAADPGVVDGLGGIVDTHGIDVVHAHGWIIHSALALRRRRPTVRTVTTLHDYGLQCPRKTLLREDGPCAGGGVARCARCATGQYRAPVAAALSVAVRRGLRHLDGLDAAVAISDEVARRSAGTLPLSARLVTIPSPAAPGLAGAPPGWLPPAPYVVFAGDPGVHKGLGVLAAACRRLDGRVRLVACCTRAPDPALDLGDAVVRVAVEPDELAAVWAHAAAAVVPSVWPEPLGLVAVEAMAQGCPVVASRTGGLAETIRDGVDGLLVAPGDAEDLATAIARLLDDPVAAARLGDAGVQRAADYAVTPIAARHVALYRELLAA